MSHVALSAATAMEVAAVRRVEPTHGKGAKARLRGYHDDVLRAAIAAEMGAVDARPLLVSMLEAELKRRAAGGAR